MGTDPATFVDKLNVQMRDGELWIVDTRGNGTVLAILPMRDAATLAERLRVLTRPDPLPGARHGAHK